MRQLLLSSVAWVSAAAQAADPSRPFAAPTVMNNVTPPGVGSLGQVTVALAVVLAFIFGVAWLTRRMRGVGKSNNAALDVVAQLPLGQKERAVLIRCGSTQILLGVAPGRVSTLHVLPEPVQTNETGEEEKSSGAARPDFKAILKRSVGL